MTHFFAIERFIRIVFISLRNTKDPGKGRYYNPRILFHEYSWQCNGTYFTSLRAEKHKIIRN